MLMTNLECALKGIESARDAIFSHLDAEALDGLNFGPDDLPIANAPEWTTKVLEALEALERVVSDAAKALDAKGAPR